MKLKNHNRYKQSEIDWLLEYPFNWEAKRLKDIAVIKTGGKNTEDSVSTGKYPFFVRSQTVEYIDSFSFNGEAILTAGDGVGVAKVFHYYIGKFETHQRVYRISHFKKVFGKFLFYFLTENLYKEVLKFNAKSTVDSLRLPMFQRFPVVLPNYEEQKSIALFLDQKTTALDKKISLLETKITHYKELSKSLINETVCRGLKKNAPLKESGIEWIGKIPGHWQVKRLKDVVTINQKVLDENTSPAYQFKYIDIGNIDSSGALENVEIIDFGNAPSRARRIVQKGDVIVSTVRTYLKAIATFNFEIKDIVVSTGFAVLSAKKNMNSNFLGYYIKSDLFVDRVGQYSSGVSYPAINPTTLATIAILQPPTEEQTAIANYLNHKTQTIEAIIKNITAQIEGLKELRKTLINDVVTGKLKVTP